MATAIHRTRNRKVPQTQPLDERQVKNAAGGYTYRLDPDKALERFLTLGTAGGTYYASERKLTQDGMALVRQCVRDLDNDVYQELVGRCGNTAPKRIYALYAIAEALISGDTDLRQRARVMARDVVKTGTDMFELLSYVRGQRGMGATVHNTFNQFLELDIDKQALWAVKYRSRHDWTWRDVLRMLRPNVDGQRDALFSWIVRPDSFEGLTGLRVVDGFRKVQGVTDEASVIEAVQEYGLPWEALTDAQRTPAVWKACAPHIGNWAVIRNLATFTRNDLHKDRQFAMEIARRIEGADRVHPVTLLEALRTYNAGGTVGRSKGGKYSPVQVWSNALEAALDSSFTNGVESTGRNVYIGLDVSGSMQHAVSGSFVLSCRDAGAALALGFVKNEPWSTVRGFTSGTDRMAFGSIPVMQPLNFTQRTGFDSAVRMTEQLPFGGTDCSMPMIDAYNNKFDVDTFIVITDNETWAGSMHPMQALREYRQRCGKPNAQLAVVALTASRNTIADPKDIHAMDFSGFSSDLPKALSAFMKMG